MTRILAIIALLITTPVAAQPDAGVCETIGEFAFFAMEKRQEGLSLSKFMNVVNEGNAELGRPALGKVFRMTAILAYEHPIQYNSKQKQKLVTEFRDQILLNCYKNAEINPN